MRRWRLPWFAKCSFTCSLHEHDPAGIPPQETLSRLEAARTQWKETASIFPSQKEFDIYLAMVHATVARERAEPGSFAQVALRLRKRDIARAVYNDLRQIDGCADQYALMHNAHPGDPIPVEGWLAYASTKSHLWINRSADVTGQPFGPQRAGNPPVVPLATYRGVADAVPDDFWKPFAIPGAPAK